jgi:hypothetical protein
MMVDRLKFAASLLMVVRSRAFRGVSNHEAASAYWTCAVRATGNVTGLILRDALLRNAPQDEDHIVKILA